MNWESVRILLIHELRMLLRDRRTVILAVVLPLFIYPVMIFATKSINERRERTLQETTYRYAVTGTDQDTLRLILAKAKESRTQAESGAQENGEKPEHFKLEEVAVKDASASLRDKEIHFYLEALTGAQADALPKETKPKQPADPTDQGEESRKEVLPAPTRLPGVPLVLIYYQGDRDVSQAGQARMHDLLTRARRNSRDATLQEHGFPIDPSKVIPIDDRNLASAGQVTGSYVGRFLTIFLVMFLLTGGSVVAMDIIAGEKERGSLETILTTAARRGEIVAAKQLTIFIVGLTITVINIANILAYVTFHIIKMPKDFVLNAPAGSVLTLLLLFIPVAAFVSSILLILSAYAKSYKEAQLYFFPVYLLSVVPPLAAVLPGISLRSAIVLVPLANVSVAVREILVGKFDWPMIVLTFLAMSAVSIWTIRASGRLLSQERLITSNESDAADFAGGAALFPRHVLRWYAVLGVVLFSVALNVPQLATLRRQVLFNELVLFLGGPLLMIWKYRLHLRTTLAIRNVKPAVWPAALLIIPSGNLVGIGVFKLANFVIPVPKQMLEQFGRDLTPANIPAWQMYLLLAVLPGICEEIAFRGTLLYGLRRKFRPVSLALIVGLIFGLFHVALFRIVPTGFLGVVLTAIALLTGSILPCMLVHAGNNAFAYWAGRHGFPLVNLGWHFYLAAVALFGVAFFILYRNRTPYPRT
ncbi:MAG TPA: ABC transporter permease subunit/CPBP intramembrane protease [Acidobacteriota bacterium]|nr:ABC transporter permease subunit/CPBP intramembrane protease [Acidobacteriota bacterium]